MKRARLIFRELQNYFFLKSIIRKESSNPASRWKTYNLRANWYGRIYTVVSLREEEMGEEEMVRNWMAMEKMKHINDYLFELGVHEIVFPSIEQIPNSRSYLVVYSPLFKEASFSWFFWRISLIVSGAFAIYFLTNM